MSFLGMNNPSRLVFISRQRSHDLSPGIVASKVLLLGALALTVGLGACSPSETIASSVENGVADSSQPVESVAAAMKTYEEDGIAISGADPVAYFSGDVSEDEFVAGSAEYAYEWNGVTWHFADETNRDLFAANPEQYAPQYGGFCAWAVSQNYTAKIDPAAWSVVDGKLYLNYDKKIQTKWQKDIPENIAKADGNWPTLAVQ